MFESRYFVRFDFVVTRRITHLPFYRGKHVNTMFRVLFAPYLSTGMALADYRIRTIPLETGSPSLEPPETVRVILSFPEECKEMVNTIIADLRKNVFKRYVFPESSHFHPQKTIQFKKAMCCQCQNDWDSSCQPVREQDLAAQISYLLTLKRFRIHLNTPLRLKRKEGDQEEHTYFNQEYFTAGNLFYQAGFIREGEELDLEVIDKHLIWIECSYKPDSEGNHQQTIGGICGYAEFRGKLDWQQAANLVAGQYNGIGKAVTLGFGHYSIVGLEVTNWIWQGSSQKLLSTYFTQDNLGKTLKKMSNQSSGSDEITVKDIQAVANKYFSVLIKSINDAKYLPSAILKYIKIKINDQQRKINITNMSELLVAKLLSDNLSHILDNIFAEHAYAWRPHLSALSAAQSFHKYLKKGFRHIIITEIEDFLESIPQDRIFKLLQVLVPDVDLISLIRKIYAKQPGLTQSNPLSPLLSNLYLKLFDDLIYSRNYGYVRYAGYLAVLVKDQSQLDAMLAKVTAMLQLLNLEINPEKTEIVTNARQIEFLDYTITPDSLKKNLVTKKEIF